MRTHSKVRTDELLPVQMAFLMQKCGMLGLFLAVSLPKMECGINRVASSHLMVEEKNL